jgi:hypothetical protein
MRANGILDLEVEANTRDAFKDRATIGKTLIKTGDEN